MVRVTPRTETGSPVIELLAQVLRQVALEPALWYPKQIAAAVGVSEKTINRHLATAGRPSLALTIRDLRLAHASALAPTHAGTAAELAMLCGWRDARPVRRALHGAVRNPDRPPCP